MSRRPLVSIVMPVYDAAATVEEAGRSLLTQTYEPLEIVVIDDGSHDRSAEIVHGLGDPRLKIIRQEHRGLVPALVRGCTEAEGEYVARLDADDVTHPERIAAQTAYLEKHDEIGLLGTWASLCDEDGRTWSFEPPPNDAALRRYLLRDNPFVHSTVMFRKQAYTDAAGYTDGPNEDYRLWIRMARAWKIAILPDFLVMHRVRRASHSGSMPRSAALRARLAAQWDAARLLGPWSRAIPPLAATCGIYGLSMLGAPERWVRSRVRGRAGPLRRGHK